MHMTKYHFIFIILFAAFSCQNREKTAPDIPWEEVIHQMEITMDSGQPDSLKAQQIKELWAKHGITPEDYRQFYDKNIEDNPEKSLPLLKQVEKSIAEEMKKEALKQREAVNKVKINVTTAPDSVLPADGGGK